MTAEQLARDILEAGLELLATTGEATGGDPQRLTAGDLVTIANMIRAHNDAAMVNLAKTIKDNHAAELEATGRRQPAGDEQIARDIITEGLNRLAGKADTAEPAEPAYPHQLTDHDLRECTAMLRASRSLLVLEADQLRRALATTHHRIRTLFYPLLLKPPPVLELDPTYVPDGRGGVIEYTSVGDD